MSAEPSPLASSTVILTSQPQGERLPPSWFAEAVVLLHALRGLSQVLTERVRVARGRMGRFETVDFGLVLLLHAISGEARLSATYHTLFEDKPEPNNDKRALRQDMALLPALWGRQDLPSRFALSRWLAVVPEAAVDALRKAFEEELQQHGLKGALACGCLDRLGLRHLLFDADATVQAARQRALSDDDQRPPPQRRRALMAKGRAGRKRACVVRSRLVLQQAHTTERLGTFGYKGNTDPLMDLQHAAPTMKAYLAARDLSPQQGVCRLDGFYGHALYIQVLAEHGLGWLVRCADYRLLGHPQLLEVLQQQKPQTFCSPDGHVQRDVYDIGFLQWNGGKGKNVLVRTRVILTLRDPLPSEANQLRIGKRFRGRVAELFCTHWSQEALLATDVLSLYLGRGGFEASLADEDRQTDPDRFVSGQTHGQQFWQILCQWVDNVRLRITPISPACRETLWSAAAQPAAEAVVDRVFGEESLAEDTPPKGGCEESKEQAPMEAIAEQQSPPPGRVASARGRGSGRYGGTDFVWQSDGTLRCPAGASLVYVGKHARRGCTSYAAPASVCAVCVERHRCLGGGSRVLSGRSVTVWPSSEPQAPSSETLPPSSSETLPPSSPQVSSPPQAPSAVVPACGPHPVWWQDVAAVTLRLSLQRALCHQVVEVARVETLVLPAPRWQTREQRAHRRQSWRQRHSKNDLPAHVQWRAHLHGVPPRIAAVLAGPDPPLRAASQAKEGAP